MSIDGIHPFGTCVTLTDRFDLNANSGVWPFSFHYTLFGRHSFCFIHIIRFGVTAHFQAILVRFHRETGRFRFNDLISVR